MSAPQILRRIVLGVVGIAALGYLSSVVSVAGCHGATVTQLRSFIAHGRPHKPVSWLSRASVPDRLAGHPGYRQDLTPEYRRRSYFIALRLLVPDHDPPWAYAFTEPTPWPFLVRSDFGAQVGPRYGRCATRLFVTFIGARREVAEWATVWW